MTAFIRRVWPFRENHLEFGDSHSSTGLTLLSKGVCTEGRANVWRLVRLYCSVLGLAVPLVLWVFGIFAGISWTLPNILCLDAIQQSESDVDQHRFSNCIYNSGAYYHKEANYALLAYWAFNYGMLGFFPMYLGLAMFGTAVKLWVIRVALILTVLLVAVTLILSLAAKQALNNFILVGASTVATLCVTVCIGVGACKPYTAGNNVMAVRWFMLLAGGSVVNALYGLVLPRLITSRSSTGQKFIIRLVAHPIIWGLFIMLFRHTCRHIGKVPNLLQVAFFVWPYIYKSIYGRFLLLQFSTVEAIVTLNLIIVIFDVVGRLATYDGDILLLRVMYGVRPGQAMLATSASIQLRVAEMVARTCCELISIVASSALFSFGHITAQAGVPPHHLRIWWTSAVQAFTFLVADFIAYAIEWKYNRVDFFKHWVKSIKPLLIFLFPILFIGCITMVTALELLFCPKWYGDGRGVLLEYCDSPSIFQFIKTFHLSKDPTDP